MRQTLQELVIVKASDIKERTHIYFGVTEVEGGYIENGKVYLYYTLRTHEYIEDWVADTSKAVEEHFWLEGGEGKEDYTWEYHRACNDKSEGYYCIAYSKDKVVELEGDIELEEWGIGYQPHPDDNETTKVIYKTDWYDVWFDI